MNCREVRRSYRTEALPATGQSSLIKLVSEHAEECRGCRDFLIVENLTHALLTASEAPPLERGADAGPDNPYLMTRIRSRIRELSEQGANSWEASILGLRGWLIGFGAVAVLLLSMMSVEWPFNGATVDSYPEPELSSLSNIGEDFMSGSAKTPEPNDQEADDDSDK